MIQKLKQLDRTILIVLFGFGVISTAVIYSATFGTKYEGLHMSNAILFGVFFVAMPFAALFDYRLLTGRLAYVLYAAGIGMLLLVIWKGEDINGSTRWIGIGGVQFQPSELAKVFTILLVAHLLAKRGGEQLQLFRDVVPLCAVVAVPCVLVLKQPDLGTAIVFVSILVGMIWIGNIGKVPMIAGISVLSGLVWAVIWLFHNNYVLLQKFVKPHQLARIQTFLDPASDPDKSWHVRNAMRAVASGQMSGQGFKQGHLVQHGFIPYSYSDSIYVAVGEEFGFLGSAVLLLLYYVLIYRMVRIVSGSGDLSGQYLVVGVISMLVLQIFENIAMHIGLMPLTGIALPLLSYGGSSLLTNMLCIGLVLSVKVYGAEPRLRS
ncbi:FtsW/RodA/SpoVE family cell cycle protein [Paenibacillus hodogayensis]|uniref:FtsW/RodA/SpoVE family cell cycle protein n=1 Tax=Paenibacillus hodogayensis TaxID=279208 RepID=A0ABV5W5F2_9BACL